MKFHIITIPFNQVKGQFETDELDAFCAHAQILSFESSTIQLLGKAYWSVLFCYETLPLTKHELPHRKEALTLSPAEAKCFDDLKDWRNRLAQVEGFPPYIIASNSLLQVLAQQRPRTLSALMELHGFGKKKATKYGKEILDILQLHQQS